MKPKPYVQLQALATLLAWLLNIGLLGPQGRWPMAVALSLATVLWSWFGFLYRSRRRRFDHRSPDPDARLLRHKVGRSNQRAAKDAVMAQSFSLGLGIPFALSWLFVVAHRSLYPGRAPFTSGLYVVVGLCLLLVPLSILVSSSVDWYLIRPYREGVHGDPVCQSSIADSESSAHYLRYWTMHEVVRKLVEL